MFRWKDWLTIKNNKLSPVSSASGNTKQGEKTASESEVELIETQLGSDGDVCGFIFTDIDGRMLWFNRLAQQWFSLSYPDDINRNITYHIRVPEFVKCFKENQFGNLCIVENLPLNISLGVVLLPYGRDYRLAIIRDLSEQQRLKVASREMLDNLSHELRSPLTVMKGYLEILESMDIKDDDRVAPAIASMTSQCDRMAQIVEDTLLLGRLETSAVDESKWEEVDMASLVDRVVKDIAQLYPNRSIQLDICEAKLRCIPSEMYSVVSNLLTNAIHYSDDDSPIKLRWYRQAEHSCLAVTDQGIGIASSVIPHLTERFYRVDKSRTSSVGGTGLGLAIVSQVLRHHQAELKIDSVVGEGSTFTCVF